MKVGQGVKSTAKFFFKPFVNIHEWLGISQLIVMTRGLREGLQTTFKVEPKHKDESFQEALKRLNISEADLQTNQQAFLRIALVMAGLSFMALIYVVYLFWQGFLMAGLIALIVSLVMLVLAYRYHFWYFQIKNRKLGCSFKEWLDAKITSENK